MKDKNDCYIYDEFDGAQEVYLALQEAALFENVYLVPHKKIGKSYQKIFSLLRNSQTLVAHDTVYQDIFIQGENYFAKLLYGESMTKNPSVSLHYIEDGLGAYVGSPIIRQDNRGNQLIKTLNPNSIFHAKIKSFYVYEPDLVVAKEEGMYHRLPKLTEDNQALKFIKKVFSFNRLETPELNHKVLFFDQPFLADGFTIDEVDLMKKIESIVPEGDLIVKYHPRSPKNKYNSVQELKTKLPWELYCILGNLSNVLLLSVATTASFTPYLMFGMDLPVIMLADLYLQLNKKENGNERTLLMLENVLSFSKKFSDQTGAVILMPRSMEELTQLLATLTESEE